MSNTAQYLLSLLIIVAIAAVDMFLIIEERPEMALDDMVWIDGSEFAATTADLFTERDPSQDYQAGGFWIDSEVVSEADFQEFLADSGYVESGKAQPLAFIVDAAKPQPDPPETVFTLRDASTPVQKEHIPRYVTQRDAMAYCEWKGLELSSRQQHLAALHRASAPARAEAITLHASQPYSQLSGFRCVRYRDN